VSQRSIYLVLVPPGLLPLLVVGQRRVEKRLARALGDSIEKTKDAKRG